MKLKHILHSVGLATLMYIIMFLVYLYAVVGLNFTLITTNMLLGAGIVFFFAFIIIVIASIVVELELENV